MNDTIDMLLEAADSLVGNTEEETINGYTLDEAAAILEAADEIMEAMNENNGSWSRNTGNQFDAAEYDYWKSVLDDAMKSGDLKKANYARAKLQALKNASIRKTN